MQSNKEVTGNKNEVISPQKSVKNLIYYLKNKLPYLEIFLYFIMLGRLGRFHLLTIFIFSVN